jgi:hypothetical protein
MGWKMMLSVKAEAMPGESVILAVAAGLNLAIKLDCFVELDCGFIDECVLLHPHMTTEQGVAVYEAIAKQATKRDRDNLDRAIRGMKIRKRKVEQT